MPTRRIDDRERFSFVRDRNRHRYQTRLSSYGVFEIEGSINTVSIYFLYRNARRQQIFRKINPARLARD
jgi:hypothetical protein